MKPLLASIAFCVPLMAAAPSAAGGYIGLGLGLDPTLGGEVDEHFDSEATGSSRLALGVRIGPVALEPNLFGARPAQLWHSSHSEGGYTPLSLGVDLKYFIPVLPRVEPYARAGLNRTWIIRPDSSSFSSHSGRGYALGGGVKLPFRALVAVQGALWLDYSRHSTRLTSQSGDVLRGRADTWMIGIALGTQI